MDFSTNDLLQEIANCDSLSGVEVLIQKAMKKQEMKKFALERLGEPKHELKKKGEKFVEQYRYSCRIDGKQVSFTGKTEEVLFEKVWNYFHTGIIQTKKDITLKELFGAYYEVRQRDTSKSFETIRYDLVTWNRFYENHPLAKMKVRNITLLDLRQFFADITGRGLLKKKAARKPLTLLIAMYDFAIPNYCEHNIAKEINFNSFYFNMSEDDSYFTEEEEEKLLAYVRSIKQDVYTLAIRLDFCFNLRIGELRALTWDDYDEEAGTLHIHHQIVKNKVNGHRTWVDVSSIKGNKESGIRYELVSDEAREILKELRKINGSKKYILQGMNGAKHPISTERFNDHMKRFCEASGITYHTSHKVRYLAITKMYEAGFDEAFIQRSAGHSTIDPALPRNYTKALV